MFPPIPPKRKEMDEVRPALLRMRGAGREVECQHNPPPLCKGDACNCHHRGVLSIGRGDRIAGLHAAHTRDGAHGQIEGSDAADVVAILPEIS